MPVEFLEEKVAIPSGVEFLDEETPVAPPAPAAVQSAPSTSPHIPEGFDQMDPVQRSQIVAQAEVDALEAKKQLDAFGPVEVDAEPDPFLKGQLTRDYGQKLDRFAAINERYQALTPIGQDKAAAAEGAREQERVRAEFEASGKGPNFAEAGISWLVGKVGNMAAGAMETFSPSVPVLADVARDVGIESKAAQDFSMVNQDPAAAIARGGADVAALLVGNPAGFVKTITAIGAKSANEAYGTTLAQTGNRGAAASAAQKAYRDMLLYTALGAAAAKGAAGLVPAEMSGVPRAIAGGVAATGANVATSGTLSALQGEEYGLQQLAADIFMGGAQGVMEARNFVAPETVRPVFVAPETVRPVGEPPAPETAAPVEIAEPPTVEQIATENGVKYDGPTELPGNPHQFTDQRTGSTFIVKGDVTPENIAENTAQLDVSFGLTPRRLGPGAANIEEAFSSREPVGAWNAKVDEQRAARGLEPLASEARKADETTWTDAERRFEENPNYGRDLVDSINEGKRESVSDTEQAALLREMLSLREARDLATTRAFDEQTFSPEERAAFLEEAKAADTRLERTEEADRKSGTAQGRALRIRRLMAYEDFTLAGLMGKARRAKGEDLTPAETEVLKTKAERFQKAKETFETKLEDAEVGQPVDDAIRAIEAEASKDPEFTPEVRSLADRIVARLERVSKGASQRIRGLMSQLGSAPDVSVVPKLVKEFSLMAAADISRGAIKFGQWATKMVKEFGEKVKPYLADAWKQADKNIDEQVSGTRTKKPKEVKDAITKTKATATADEIGAGMKAKGGKISEMRGDIQKLVETLVRGGIKQREPLVDAVHEVLKGVDPSITRRQTMDAISGYGDFKPLNKDAVKAEVRDLKQQLQLSAKIEDVLGSVPLKRSGIERQPLSDEGRALTKKLNELSRELGIKITDPATQLKSILGALETRLTNRIKDLRAEISKGQRTVKAKTPTPTNPKIEALRTELEQVQAQHEAVFGKETRKMTDEQKIRIYKTRTQNRIKELETRIQKQDFGPRPKRIPLDVSKDPEAVKAKAEMERVKKEFQQKQFEWEQAQRSRTRKFVDGVKETLAASRSLITSADVSAPFRQGGFLLLGDLVFHPIRAAKQIATMFHQLVSEKGFEEAQAAIALRPNARAGLYDQSGLYLSDLSTKLSAREENMRSNLAERIPVVGRIVRASNRAYAGFLNRQRADSFDAMVESMGGPSRLTPEQLKAIANFVNTATGRGTVAQLERAADVAARYFFSPRFLASRFQLALGQPLAGPARRVAAQQYAKLAVGLAAIYGLSQLAGGKVEKDPRSADFGKAKFGNTRVDPLAGLAQVTTFLSRMITGQTKKAGRIEKRKRSETFTRFARTKLAPIPGVLADVASEQTLDMQKPTVAGSIARLTVPLSYQEAPQVYKEHGALRGTILEVLNLLGMGVQSYDKR